MDIKYSVQDLAAVAVFLVDVKDLLDFKTFDLVSKRLQQRIDEADRVFSATMGGDK